MLQPKQPPFRVVIADDHDFFRDGLKSMLTRFAQPDFQIVGEATNGAELIDQVRLLQPHLVITDIKMPVLDGLEACKKIVGNYPEVKVIALSSFDDSALVYDMIEAGAKGYLLKNTARTEILEAMQEIMRGGVYYCSGASKILLKRLAVSRHNLFLKNPSITFSAMETTIIRHICKQETTKEMAENLRISVRTVEEYSSRIKDKTGARNLVGIALFAIKNGIVALDEL